MEGGAICVDFSAEGASNVWGCLVSGNGDNFPIEGSPEIWCNFTKIYIK